MKKRLLKIAGILLGLILLTIVAAHFFFQEPEYKGRTVTAWIKDLESRDHLKRMEAEQAILALGQKGLPVLSSKAQGIRGRVRELGKKASEYLPQRINSGLRKLFGVQNSDQMRSLALKAIQTLGTNGEPAIPTLTNILRDANSLVSYQAALALQTMPGAADSVILALDDASYQSRANACVALQGLGPHASNATPRLMLIIENETGPFVATASYTLSRIGLPAIPVLTNGLKHTNALVRHWSAVSLASMDALGLPAVPALCEAANDPDTTVRQSVITAIRKIDRVSPIADEVMLAALHDPSPVVQMEAMESLAFRGRVVRGHRAVIEQVLQHPNERMRKLAEEALSRYKPRPAPPQK